MAWSHLQGNGAHTGNVATVAAAYTSNLTPSSKLIVWVALNTGSTASAPTTASVDDGNGNNFANLVSQSFTDPSSNHLNLSCWVLDTPGGDVGTKPTITAHCNNTGSSSGMAIAMQEVTGLAVGTTTAILDGSIAFAQNNTPNSNPVNFPTYSSTALNEYLIQVWSDYGSNLTLSAPSGYSGLDGANGPSDTDALDLIAWKNSTAGSETGTWTGLVTNVSYIIAAVAFKLAIPAGAGLEPIVQPSLAAQQGSRV